MSICHSTEVCILKLAHGKIILCPTDNEELGEETVGEPGKKPIMLIKNCRTAFPILHLTYASKMSTQAIHLLSD